MAGTFAVRRRWKCGATALLPASSIAAPQARNSSNSAPENTLRKIAYMRRSRSEDGRPAARAVMYEAVQ